MVEVPRQKRSWVEVVGCPAWGVSEAAPLRTLFVTLIPDRSLEASSMEVVEPFARGMIQGALMLLREVVVVGVVGVGLGWLGKEGLTEKAYLHFSVESVGLVSKE